ncbi:hypothetical protein [Pleomorphomonas oryzae]|uniref:hypothetical protein n=1 Tax=Pleomorphomonas oryzae TaxID=261934 RepID=UPI0003FE281D|nr:hypothetical protein [Pleomorphomonas oryzae]
MVQSIAETYMGARGSLPFEDMAQAGAVSGAITASGQSVVVPISAYNGAVFAWWGTFSGINLSFEAAYEPSLANWIAISALPASGGSPVTSLSNLASANAYEVYAPGALAVRIRATAYTSGTMNVRAIPVAMMQDIAPALSGGALSSIGLASAGSGALTTVARLVSAAASVNATVAKASTGRLYKIYGYNAATTVRFLKLYNKSSAPTVGTDVPVVTIPLTPSREFDIDLGLIGQYFSTGIAYALTTGAADTDTGALTAADVVGLAMWVA